MSNFSKIISIFGVTLAIWFFVGIVKLIGGSGEALDAILILAFLSSLALWLVTGFYLLAQNPQEGSREKAKRGDDARLASLLLDLLKDDQRQELRQQLMDELGSDGEAVSLETLLASQKKRQS